MQGEADCITGVILTLEVPFKDDLAHNAPVPSLVASVASYVTKKTGS